MNRLLYTLLFIFFIIVPNLVSAQDRVADSLRNILNNLPKNERSDSTACTLLKLLFDADNSQHRKMEYCEQRLKIAKKALKEKNLTKEQFKFFKRQCAGSYNCYAIVYHNQGNIPVALNYYDTTLHVLEEIEDLLGMSHTLTNIGITYFKQNDIPKALEYYEKSLSIREKIGDKFSIANSLNNIGLVHNVQGNSTKALSSFNRSLQLRQEIGDKKGLGVVYNNIGLIYLDKKEYESALEYLSKGLNSHTENGNKLGIAQSCFHFGRAYFMQNNLSRSMEYISRSMQLSKELGEPEQIRNAAEILTKVYRAMGKSKQALESYELFIQMRDSINNESTRKASIKQQLKHEYETKAAADSVAHEKESDIKNAELAKQKAEISAKKNQQYALFGGLFGVCVFGVFMYNRFKVTQKQKMVIESQKEIVEEQKKLVEEKQKEILDSIRYAKRIQMAQIPSEKRVENTLGRLRK